MIFKKLAAADDRYREIEQMLTLPEVVSNNKEYSKLIKEYKYLEPIITKFREYKEVERGISESEDMMRDSSFEFSLCREIPMTPVTL